jgi:hypothetical protein
MRTSSGPGGGLLVAGLILLHFILRPVLTSWAAGPDLLTGALLLGALQLRAGPAALLGFFLGLLDASMALKGMGALMIVYTIAGFAAAKSRDLLFSDSAVFVPTFLFVGVWAVQVAVAGSTGGLDLMLGLVIAPLSAAATALVCWLAARIVGFAFRSVR